MGCIGVASLYMGRLLTSPSDFKECYSSFNSALAARDALNKAGGCPGSTAGLFAKAWTPTALKINSTDFTIDETTDRITWNDRNPADLDSGYDFGFYDDSGSFQQPGFWHATSGASSNGRILFNYPNQFEATQGNTRTVIYCVSCRSNDLWKLGERSK